MTTETGTLQIEGFLDELYPQMEAIQAELNAKKIGLNVYGFSSKAPMGIGKNDTLSVDNTSQELAEEITALLTKSGIRHYATFTTNIRTKKEVAKDISILVSNLGDLEYLMGFHIDKIPQGGSELPSD